MIAVRLVRHIENHSDALTDSLLARLLASARTAGLRSVPRENLRRRSYEILHHLSEWLLTKSVKDIEQRYREIGSLRAAQGIPLAHVCWGIVLTKEHLWDFVQQEGFFQGPLEIYGAMELQRLLDQFFDRAICYCTEGYEAALRSMPGPFTPLSQVGDGPSPLQSSARE